MIGPFFSSNETSGTWNVSSTIAFLGGDGSDGGSGGAIQEDKSWFQLNS